MVSIYETKKVKVTNGSELVTVELRGLSTDEKPSTLGDKQIDNGSEYIEMDTGKIFFYDLENEEWKEA